MNNERVEEITKQVAESLSAEPGDWEVRAVPITLGGEVNRFIIGATSHDKPMDPLARFAAWVVIGVVWACVPFTWLYKGAKLALRFVIRR